MKKTVKSILIIFILLFVFGMLVPQGLKMPVEGANKQSYNSQTFWYYPWGKSVTHKGIDIFAKRGTPVRSATSGFVLFTAEKLGAGGNVVVVLGPKWRLHYYAHLDKIKTRSFRFITQDKVIGTVGNSGNAQKTPAHLHYSILTPIPYVWLKDDSIQGWKKMFYLNPIGYFDN